MFRTFAASLIGMAFMLAPAYAKESNLLETAKANDNLSTFVTAVKAAGYEDKLSGKQKWTILAPTNEAFAKLPDGTVDNLLKPENKAKLQAIIQRHMVEGKIWASKMANEELELKTASKSVIRINARSKPFMVDGVSINSLNNVASNGTIHTIDGVLLTESKRTKINPPSRYN